MNFLDLLRSFGKLQQPIALCKAMDPLMRANTSNELLESNQLSYLLEPVHNMAAFSPLPPADLWQRKGPFLADVCSDGSKRAFSTAAIEISRGGAKPYVHAGCESGSSRKTHKLVPGVIKELSVLIYFSGIYRHSYGSYF